MLGTASPPEICAFAPIQRQMRVDWRDTIAIAVIIAIIAAISIGGIQPLKIGLSLAVAMVCIYALMVVYFGRGSCIEMGIAVIILTVNVMAIIGIAGKFIRRHQLKTQQKVQQPVLADAASKGATKSEQGGGEERR